MKLLVKSFAAIAVAAALAVPFIQADRNAKDATQTDYAQKALNRAQLAASAQASLPAIHQALSVQTNYVPDFADIFDINERKKEFFAYLLPAIEELNERILAQREMLLVLQEKHDQELSLTVSEQNWLADLVDYYRVDEETLDGQFQILNRRVDIVPATVVLIQAANESGWGTSRFAREGLNFFGQWCWTAGCGIVPASRPAGQVYEVRRFESMEDSVKSFVRNLNTHFAYQELRAMRLEERTEDDQVSSATVTAGLISYSERGQDYIDELNQMIRINRSIIDEVRSLSADVSS